MGYLSLLALSLAILGAPWIQAKDVNLAVLLPYSGHWPVGRLIAGAVSEAVEYVNSHPDLLEGRTLKFFWRNTRCKGSDGLRELVEMYFEKQQTLHGIIGGGCDQVCEPTGMLAAGWNLPMVSWGCSSGALSNKETYPTFARTVGPYTKMADMFPVIARHFGWTRMGILASSESVWQVTSHAIKLRLQEQNISVSDFHTFSPGQTDRIEAEDHSDLLLEVALHAKIIIVCASAGDVRSIMLKALDGGLINGEYAFITLALTEEPHIGLHTWMGDDGRDAEAAHAFTGLMNIHVRTPNTDEYMVFEDNVRRRSHEDPFSYRIPADVEVEEHAGMLYDAILLYVHALHDTLHDGEDEFHGKHVASRMFNMTFKGMSGNVLIDEHGDRNQDYALEFHNGVGFVEVADYFYGDSMLHWRDESLVVHFAGGATTPPLDHPPCGWDDEFCDDGSGNSTLIITVTTVVLVAGVCMAALFLLYRRSRNEAELNSMELWKINFAEINVVTNFSQSKKTLASHHTMNSNRSDHTEVSNSAESKQTFAKVAHYKSALVALKGIKSEHVIVKRDLLVEFKHMRDLHHDNINIFVGACVEAPNIYAVFAYCSRGSLQDILENDEIKVTEEFKMSFLMDISKAMEFLHHSPLGSHGSLKSSNCLVDNRWMCKITDYGMHVFKRNQTMDTDKDDYKRYHALLWTAPELLKMAFHPPYGTKKGDVYSFGIIMQEVILRSGPFSMIDKEPAEMIQMIRYGLDPPFRPMMAPNCCSPEMRQLLEQCWSEKPEKRPVFSEIKKLLKICNKGKSINLMDHMLKMMEQYADHLEELVNDRTTQLEEEKKKTDALLHQMLPKTVAEKLKLGKLAEPETFTSVTIYFSDIVGFTKLASNSTPLQVVDLLNDLYITFDDIIGIYDVYKVETIGDAYMVASGLPVPNGLNHAGEIATMSLDILSSLANFTIRHMPGTQLQLRIGIHTGSVVGGVVGLKMPRYCLFGDTVNTASRMESSSTALRIHISESTMAVLTVIGGYTVEERGMVQMKGKGKVKTFWLTGKSGFNKPLPDLALAAPLEDHEFK